MTHFFPVENMVNVIDILFKWPRTDPKERQETYITNVSILAPLTSDFTCFSLWISFSTSSSFDPFCLVFQAPSSLLEMYS